jgi:hypothetical protein
MLQLVLGLGGPFIIGGGALVWLGARLILTPPPALPTLARDRGHSIDWNEPG